MALEDNDLRVEFTGRQPDKRMIPKEGGGIAVGELAVHVGAPLLPEGCPVAFNSLLSQWQVYTQPSDAAAYTITDQSNDTDGGSLDIIIDGLQSTHAWNTTPAAAQTELLALLANAGKGYTVAVTCSEANLGVAAAILTLTFSESAGAPSVEIDTAKITDGGVSEPGNLVLAASDAGTVLSGTNIIRGFVADSGGVQTSAADEVQFNIFKAGSAHRDDLNNAAVRAVCGGAPSEGELDAALVAVGIRDDGIDIQGLAGIH